MSIGKSHSLDREGVDVWRLNLSMLCVEAVDVAVAKVITHDEYNVWRGRFYLEEPSYY